MRERLVGTVWLDEVVITWPDGCQAAYDFEPVENTFDVLQRTRVNTVSLIPTWDMDDKYSTSIHPDNLRTRTKTYPDAELTGAIDALHQRGLRVLLKPHVDVQDGTWRAEITPQNLGAWFRGYKAFIIPYARLAQQHRVELFAVGTELESLQGPAYREEWGAIIREIRRHYHGKLLYAANWAGNKQTGPAGDYRGVAFWALLDVVGIDAYSPLSEAQNPSLQELIAGWTNYRGEVYGTVERHNWVEELDTWQAYIKKPIIFAEIGYPSTDFAAQKPWKTSKGAANPGLQARCYEAAIRVWANKPWLQGFIWWGWSPFTDAGGLCDMSYTPQNKPAQALL